MIAKHSQEFTTMKHIGKSGQLIAAAAFTLAVSGIVSTLPSAAAENVQCSGVNSCKGHSECKTGNSGCKGQNACKGQGWLSLSKADCEAKGGKVVTG
jgi:hypothetical protein